MKYINCDHKLIDWQFNSIRWERWHTQTDKHTDIVTIQIWHNVISVWHNVFNLLPLVIVIASVMNEYHEIGSDKHLNKFGCPRIAETNIRIYLDVQELTKQISEYIWMLNSWLKFFPNIYKQRKRPKYKQKNILCRPFYYNN